MGSNNFAVVVTDAIKARQILADFERLAAQGSTFKLLEFGRESNFPCLQDVEEAGATVDGLIAQALWNRDGDAVEAVNFGNGFVGLFCESDELSYMAIPNGKSDRG